MSAAPRRALAFLAPALLLAACSLRYDTVPDASGTVPELTFSTVTYTRYKDGARSLSLGARTLEQYRDNGSTYARGATFCAWNADGEPGTEGSCDLLALDAAAESYALFGGIFLHNKPGALTLRAESLRWNGASEQLTAGAGQAVSLTKDGLSLSGTGFSASAATGSFAFSGAVSGTFTQDDAGEAP